MLTIDPVAVAMRPKLRIVEVAVTVMVCPMRNAVDLLPAVPRSVGYPSAVGAAQPPVLLEQYWPLEQVVIVPWMQPAPVAVQVSDEVSPVQLLPAVLPQPLVGAGQLQAAVPPLAEQTNPDVAQLVSAS